MSNPPLETVTVDLELREPAALEERIVTARLVPYGETSMATGNPRGERFLKGAFRRSIKHRAAAKRPVLLFHAHDHTRAIGQAVSLKDTDEGPIGEFRIGRTTRGDEALTELKEGLLPQVSVGFRPIMERMGDDGAREIREAMLAEVSLAPMGAYDGAEVLQLRTPEPAGPDLAWVSLPPIPAVDPSRPVTPWG